MILLNLRALDSLHADEEGKISFHWAQVPLNRVVAMEQHHGDEETRRVLHTTILLEHGHSIDVLDTLAEINEQAGTALQNQLDERQKAQKRAALNVPGVGLVVGRS